MGNHEDAFSRKAQATSPLSVTNREFPNLKGTIQLRLVDGKIDDPAFQGKDMTGITFDQITDNAILRIRSWVIVSSRKNFDV